MTTIDTGSAVVDLGHDDRSPQAIGVKFRKAYATRIESTWLLIECGQLLREKRRSLQRGEWLSWLEANREILGFSEGTAQRLMRVATNNPALTTDLKPAEVLKLNRQIWGNTAKSREPSRLIETSRTPSQKSKPKENPDGFDAASTLKAPDEHCAGVVQADDPAPGAGDWDQDEVEALERVERELTESIDKVMRSDDKLAAAHHEIKRQAAEIAALKTSRDGYMNGQGEVIRRYKGAQRQIERLTRKCADLERENERLKADDEALRERVAIMEQST